MAHSRARTKSIQDELQVVQKVSANETNEQGHVKGTQNSAERTMSSQSWNSLSKKITKNWIITQSLK